MVTSKIRLDFTEHWCHAVVEACTFSDYSGNGVRQSISRRLMSVLGQKRMSASHRRNVCSSCESGRELEH
jgi:hypothetical protein